MRKRRLDLLGKTTFKVSGWTSVYRTLVLQKNSRLPGVLLKNTDSEAIPQTYWMRSPGMEPKNHYFSWGPEGIPALCYAGDQWCRQCVTPRSRQHYSPCACPLWRERVSKEAHLGDCCYGPLIPKVWSLSQKLGYHRRACEKCRNSGTTPDLLNHNLHFNKLPRHSGAC